MEADKRANNQVGTVLLDTLYNVSLQDAARAKALRAKFEEWEAAVGEDGGYINLVDENGCALETASKLKNRYCCPVPPSSLGHTTHSCFAGLRS